MLFMPAGAGTLKSDKLLRQGLPAYKKTGAKLIPFLAMVEAMRQGDHAHYTDRAWIA